MNFATADSLEPVECLVNRAGTALKNIACGFVLGLPLGDPFAAAVKFIVDKIKENKRLSEVKLNLYKEAVKRQNAIIKVLQNQSKLDAERIAELTEINAELTKVIREMKEDLESAASRE